METIASYIKKQKSVCDATPVRFFVNCRQKRGVVFQVLTDGCLRSFSLPSYRLRTSNTRLVSVGIAYP